MPFLSKDWRSPGEKWVRYEGGWEMKKTIWTSQSLRKDKSSNNLFFDNITPTNSVQFERPQHKQQQQQQQQQQQFSSSWGMMEKENELPAILVPRKLLANGEPIIQPYCPITVKSTKEVAGFNALADALHKLDFLNAVRDVRRFNYVSKIMYTLFSHDR